jgi:hypothetical protein
MGTRFIKWLMKIMRISLGQLVNDNELLDLLQQRIKQPEDFKKWEALIFKNEQSDDPPKAQDSSKTAKTPKICEVYDNQTCLSYAKYGNEVIGVILSSSLCGKFVFALRNACSQVCNVKLEEARNMAAALPPVDGHHWIVPSDEYLKVAKLLASEINRLFVRLNGHQITQTAFLSSTELTNQPVWNVRFVLPLEKD